MHSLSIVDWKVQKYELVDWLLINWKVHIKFHSKFFILIKYDLKNEIIKLSVKYYFKKP